MTRSTSTSSSEEEEPPVFHNVRYGDVSGNLMITSDHMIFQESDNKRKKRHPLRLKKIVSLDDVETVITNTNRLLLTIVVLDPTTKRSLSYTFELDSQDHLLELQRDLKEHGIDNNDEMVGVVGWDTTTSSIPSIPSKAADHEEEPDPTTSSNCDNHQQGETKTTRTRRRTSKWSIKNLYKRTMILRASNDSTT